MPDDATETTLTQPTESAETAAVASDTEVSAPQLGARKNARKIREGLVSSVAMDKTAIVISTDRVRHRRYNKTVQRNTRLYVHDETNQLSVGDRVRVQETRPLSKTKRWRLVEIVERAR